MMPTKHSSLLLLACAVMASTIASAAAVEPRAETQKLIEWIRSKNGGSYSSKQEERLSANGKTRGIFATEIVLKDEVLLEVPWDSVIGSSTATREVMENESQEKSRILREDRSAKVMITQCRAIEAVYKEVIKGESSDFAPHLEYLSLLDDSESFLPTIPSIWSQDGKDLLEDINDHGNLPPYGIFTVLNHDLYGACIEDIENDLVKKKVASVVAAHASSGEILAQYGIVKKKVASVVAAHASSGEILAQYGIIVPLLDNYHYNQRLKGEERTRDDYSHINVKGKVNYGKSVQLIATRDIGKGEQIFRPYGNGNYGEYQSDQIFRDYGIINEDIYPKYYEFQINPGFADEVVFGVDIDKNDKNDHISFELVAYNQEEDIDEDVVEAYFEGKLNWLKRLKRLAFKNDVPKNSNMTEKEWSTAWAYHKSLVDVMTMVLKDIKARYGDDEVECPGGLAANEVGSCPIWDGFPPLPNIPITDLDLEFVPGPYGPSEEAYAMCNDEDIAEWKDYVPPGDEEVIMSNYQEIRFFTNPKTEDMVMKLDSTVQQVSSYRPHYHEFAVHFPARFLESVKRVLFVGGGDSMVLHEVLKYPSLEKVVGLELDQFVLRNSFRYFDTQPHFDDKRVEWWFGDGAKSLLMLPKDYFQSFDLVVVDLSETVMSFQVTDKLSIFQTLSLLLKPDGILLKNGEYYMDKMSQYFDYTLQYFEYDVPFICDQGMVIGSNKIDFFNHTLKDHGVELLVLESQEEINEKFNEFYRFTEYRKNDANKQGQCGNQDSGTENMQNAGILIVVEAEKVTHDLTSTNDIQKTMTAALINVGFSVVSSTVKTVVSTGKHGSSTVIIVTKEGYVAARLFPEHNYVGLDIQNWANFDLMETARDALVQSLGGTEEGTSSFRIVTGGMRGSPFENSDRSKVGPRMVNSRDCGTKSSPTTSTSVHPTESGLKGSLELVEGGIVAAVLCGSKDTPCKSVDVLKNDSGNKIKTVVPLHTCASLLSDSAEFSANIAWKMASCETELSTALAKAGGDDKISFFVVDESAKQIIGKVILGIFTSVWNRKRLFAQNRFVAFVDGTHDVWRRNLLLLLREQILWSPMSLIDVKVENSDKKSKISILSLNDTEFFLHLSQMVDKFDHVHGGASTMEVESVFDGLVRPQIGHFNPKIFKADDYDQKPARDQLAGQKSLGRQSIVQFEIKPRAHKPSDTASEIKSALSGSVPAKDELVYSTVDGKDAGIGDGQIIIGTSSEVLVIVVWDGNTHIDVNLYLSDEDPYLRELFIDAFVRELGKTLRVKQTLSDTHPRGIGRVVSFPGHRN